MQVYRATVLFVGFAILVLYSGCGSAPSLDSKAAQDRYHAVKNLQLDDLDSLVEVLSFINDESKIVRLAVLEKLSEWDGKEGLNEVVKLLEDKSWEVRKEAVRLICSKQYKKAYQTILVIGKDDKSEFVRAEVARFILLFGQKDESIALLKGMMSDESQMVRYYVAEQLNRSNN